MGVGVGRYRGGHCEKKRIRRIKIGEVAASNEASEDSVDDYSCSAAAGASGGGRSRRGVVEWWLVVVVVDGMMMQWCLKR